MEGFSLVSHPNLYLPNTFNRGFDQQNLQYDPNPIQFFLILSIKQGQ